MYEHTHPKYGSTYCTVSTACVQRYLLFPTPLPFSPPLSLFVAPPPYRFANSPFQENKIFAGTIRPICRMQAKFLHDKIRKTTIPAHTVLGIAVLPSVVHTQCRQEMQGVSATIL